MSKVLNVHVVVHVQSGSEEAFVAASAENARCSRMEPGVVRFDLLRSEEEPGRFLLVEVYRDAEAAVAHKETPHYAVWRDTVAPMMAEPRTNTKWYSVDSPDTEAE